jgi:hypothetical protein
MQVLPEQQPSAQFAGQSLHAPALQLWLPLHFSQAAPPTPQFGASWVVFGMQIPAEQQPSGQDPGVQLHAPLMQASPAGHAGFGPQRHS